MQSCFDNFNNLNFASSIGGTEFVVKLQSLFCREIILAYTVFFFLMQSRFLQESFIVII